MIRLDEDHHVHTTFSDGRGTVSEMAEQARHVGLRQIGLADHVRRDSDWLDAYVAEVESVRPRFPELEIRVGVEAKILDHDGTLDLPELPDGVQQVVIADHQVPGPDGPLRPDAVRAAVEAGSTDAEAVVHALVASTARAIHRCPRDPIVGHLFSVLPKLGIPHDHIDPRWADPIFDACRARGARLEVDERWRSPGPAVVERALRAGVHVVASTDSHKVASVGRYRYVRQLVGATPCG